MDFHRGKVRELIVGPRWRVKHHAYRGLLPPPKSGAVDIVGAATEQEVRQKIKAAYVRPRAIVSVERID